MPSEYGFDEAAVFNGPGDGKSQARTDATASNAVHFIRENKARPFFCYIPFHIVHAPHQAKEEDLKRVGAGVTDETKRTYAAMVQSLEHFRPLINGYSGQRPDFYPAVVDAVRGFPSDDALVTLHDRGVQYVVTPVPVTIRSDSPVALRATVDGGVIYELVWTPEVEARLALRSEIAPVPPGPWRFASGERAVYRVHWDGGLSLDAGTITLSIAAGPRFVASAVTSPAGS